MRILFKLSYIYYIFYLIHFIKDQLTVLSIVFRIVMLI